MLRCGWGGRGQAQDTCRRARELFPQDAELRFREGVLLHDLGRMEEARRAYLDVLENREERHFTSVDRAITGFKARQNLAVVAADLGDMADAEHQWRAVVREAPRYRTGWRGLGDILLRLGRLNDAHSLAEKLIRDDVLSVEGMLLKHRVALIQGRLQEARMQVTRATMEYPNDLEALRSLCQFLFAHGTPDEAELALRHLIARDPEDASAHHNLGTLLLRCHRLEESEQAYRQSLCHRADHLGTYLQLGYVLRASGRTGEAAVAWKRVLQLSPGHPEASAVLRELPPVGTNSTKA